MVNLIQTDQPKKVEKKYTFKAPDITGKFGISLCLGKKEIFIGIAIANIEVEQVVKKRKVKIFRSPGRGTFIPS